MSGLYPSSGVPGTNALNTVDVDSVNCADGELFYSTARCTPRFDPAAANAGISELLNTVAAAGLAYDCSRLDNLSLAIQQFVTNVLTECLPEAVDGNIPAITEPLLDTGILTVFNDGDCNRVGLADDAAFQAAVETILERCLELDLPDLSETCGNPTFLTVVEQGGCYTLATYEPDAEIANGCFGGIPSSAHLPQNAAGFVIPDDFQSPLAVYDLAGLRADDNFGAGTPNAGVINNSLIASIEFENPCTRNYNVRTGLSPIPGGDANLALSQRAQFTYRYQVNAGPWQWPRNGANEIVTYATINAILPQTSVEFNQTFPAGNVRVQIIYLADMTIPGADPGSHVNLNANTYTPGSGFVCAPGTVIRPNV